MKIEKREVIFDAKYLFMMKRTYSRVFAWFLIATFIIGRCRRLDREDLLFIFLIDESISTHNSITITLRQISDFFYWKLQWKRMFCNQKCYWLRTLTVIWSAFLLNVFVESSTLSSSRLFWLALFSLRLFSSASRLIPSLVLVHVALLGWKSLNFFIAEVPTWTKTTWSEPKIYE